MGFKLLEVPSEAVQIAAMTCVQQVDFGDMTTEEVGYLPQLLDSAKDIAREESLLEKVVLQMQAFANDTRSYGAGLWFRQDHAEKCISSVWSVLMKNSCRITYGDPREEEQKTMLSQACVAFLKT